MGLTEVMPLVAGVLFVFYFLWYGATSGSQLQKGWIFPAVLSMLFFFWSGYAAIMEGLTGFWPEHVRNLWGNQIWFDLLLAASVALTFLVPQSRVVGMRSLPWCVLVIATGSIGLMAMLSRYLYLKEKQGK